MSKYAKWGILFLVLSTLYLLGYFIYNYQHLNLRKEQIQSDLAGIELKDTYNKELALAFGYGGFIHHFKNYLIRGEPQLIDAFNSHALILQEIMEDYKKLHVSEVESSALLLIEETITSYISNFTIIVEQRKSAQPITEIDKIVRIDDSNAINSINLITNLSKKDISDAQESLQIIAQSQKDILINSLITLIVFTFANLLIFSLLRHLEKALTEKKQQLHSLRYSEERYRSIVDGVADAIIIMNKQGIIEQVNSAAEKIFAYSAAEMIDQNVKLLMPESIASHHDDYLQNYLSTNQATIIGKRRDAIARRKDGYEFPVIISVNELKLDNIHLFIGLIHDISQQLQLTKTLEKQKALFEGVFSDVPDAIVVTDPERNMIKCSPSLLNLFGYTEAELLGKPTQVLYESEKEFARQGKERFNRSAKHKNDPYIVKYRTKEGKVFTGETVGTVMKSDNGTVYGYLGVIRDITDRINKEKALKVSNRDLETLGLGNEVVARSANETELFNDICKVLVTKNQRKLAWIGLKQDDEDKNVLAVAQYGYDQGYLDSIKISWADTEIGRGPVGNAIRSGKTQVIQNTLSDESFKPWQKDALKRGYNSCIAIPLVSNDSTIGSINLYSAKVNAFEEQTIDYLEKLAENVASGMLKLREQSARLKAESMLEENRQLLAQTNQMLSLVMDAIPSRVFWKDTSLNYLGCNQLFAKYANLASSKDIIGKNDYQMPWKPEADLYQADDQSIIESGVAKIGYEECQTGPGGQRLWLRTSKIPLNDIQGKRIGILGIYDDISETKQITEDLIKAKNAAEKANQAKTYFLSNMSHELKTPLNAVLGYAQLLQLSDHIKTDDRENISEILKAGEHLLNLINEILDLNKIESGKIVLNPETLDIKVMIEDCILLLKPQALKQNITITFKDQSDVLVKADKLRLKQVLLNLLSNAIKYNHEGGSVQVILKKDNSSKYLDVQIIDSGIGIKEDTMKELFQPFVRHVPENSIIEGSGIGLALSQKLIQQMSGHISVESKIGHGSIFTLSLPYSG